MVILGLKNCDTCRKAKKALETAELRDVRDTPLTSEERARLVAHFGEDILNKRSKTWRDLDEAARALAPDTLLAQSPTVMKRPVIDGPAGLTLGWSDVIKARHLGTGGAG